ELLLVATFHFFFFLRQRESCQSDAIKVVITATPYRNDLFELNVDLDDYFIFTFKQAISDKIITEPNFIQVNSMEKMLQEVQLFLE
ncbi:hypothetical protein, partial [Escherichia coli]|uniref:hypothetical protein n=1 Tax=Escherichia coli TaxID=562 RepID=UPI00208DCB55